MWNVRWTNVRLDDSTHLEVRLWDRNFENDDPMGTAIITAADMRLAQARGRVLHVRVAEQTQKQVLFLGVTVR